MNKKNVAILSVGILIGILLLLGFRSFMTDKHVKPEIGGQEVPDSNFVIDFSKRYNLIYSQDEGRRSFENIKIIGYTGTKVKEASGASSDSYDVFNHWLVIERMDGRKVFVPSSGISYLEEAESPKK